MHQQINQLLSQLRAGSFRALAKAITIVENELNGNDEILCELQNTTDFKVIGVTGPPGAGKSTLIDGLTAHWAGEGKKVAILAIDPSSPFNYGALLGDRIRMRDHFNNQNVYIRSLATRGSLGGLNAKIIEITDVVKEAGFDRIIIETVGVGQSEVEIAGLADCTVLVLIPESGDDVQTMKSGIMEIADVYVVNKSDRPEADALYHNLTILTHSKATNELETPVIKTVGTERKGILELADAITGILNSTLHRNKKRLQLLTEKSIQIIQKYRMKDFNRHQYQQELNHALKSKGFNLYVFLKDYL